MSKPPPRIYWDANAWIAYIKKEMPRADNKIKDPRFEMCRDVLMRAIGGNIEIATSAFSLSEVCKRRDEATGPSNLPAFFQQPYILVIPVDMQCGSACKKDPLSGVIGVQKGPLISMV